MMFIFRGIGSFLGLVGSGVAVDKLTKQETFYEKHKEVLIVSGLVILFLLLNKK